MEFYVHRSVVLRGNDAHFSAVVGIGAHDYSRLGIVVEVIQNVTSAKSVGGKHCGGVERGCIVIVGVERDVGCGGDVNARIPYLTAVARTGPARHCRRGGLIRDIDGYTSTWYQIHRSAPPITRGGDSTRCFRTHHQYPLVARYSLLQRLPICLIIITISVVQEPHPEVAAHICRRST